MQSLVSSPVFQLYIGAVILLGLNLLVLANNTALSRASRKEAVNPEDKKLDAEVKVVGYNGAEHTQRYRRAHGNALENLPLFLITGFLLTLTKVPFVAAAVLFGIFVGFRLLHSAAYVKGLQPYRTASFAIAALDQIALLGFLGYYVYAS
jgi:glutathione S-transferase